ncbi:ROK family transcriptional regulator [Jiella avicenniae]|uniref:ROK family transcriptional regulator n=1 Tax=Jiella avicenniae TaxID=2907202 RepID=A0A9X1T4B1_9HYPH|nr:ROK family transcriptional regulator [Jiella avicenniae]MCE7027702.1 ROK family transcriptional regulator [Jiella avicenniae]MCE7028744.1 ROK family transcriptional regulator [Jiella avicenniae]
MGFSHLSRPGESFSAAELTPSAKAVFRSLVASGPATRPQIGEQLALSRPTMSASIGELERLGYVEKVGESQGSLGRKAALYRVGAGAGRVMAIDAGSTHVRLRVATLDHRLLHSRTYRLPASHRLMNEEISRAVAEEFAAAAGEAETGWGPLRAVGIALPSRVVADGAERAATRQDELFTHFAPPAGPELVLENNVNCAAVAERVYGVAKGRDDFAYIQIGLKLGMGLMLSGRLIRGRNGAAGEIGHLAYPFAPGHTPVAGEAETYLGTEMLMRRVRQAWPEKAGPPPEDAGALFHRAENGDAPAREHVERHAADIGALVASCVAIVDPGLVVLGGGVGTSPLILPVVRTVANALSYPVDVETSSLGPDATVLGIEKLAVDRALDVVLVQTSP